MSDSVYHSLLGLMNDIFNGDSKVSLEELEDRIQQAYSDNRISGIQYDHLMGNIQDYL